MKREVILLYMKNDAIYIYLVNAKKEIIKSIDTSFFFKFGEIFNVSLFNECITKLVYEERILSGILKPVIHVLYNDVTNCDLKYLYTIGLSAFNYEKITFYPLSKIIKTINDRDTIVLFDKDYYTDFLHEFKTNNQKSISLNALYIGKNSTENIHYADEFIIWKTFISHFTKN